MTSDIFKQLFINDGYHIHNLHEIRFSSKSLILDNFIKKYRLILVIY